MLYDVCSTDKQLSTPPLNGLILPGVTRRSIIELASQWEDIVVKEEVITMERVIELNKQGRVSFEVYLYHISNNMKMRTFSVVFNL